jgi:hypothetical protein
MREVTGDLPSAFGNEDATAVAADRNSLRTD